MAGERNGNGVGNGNGNGVIKLWLPLWLFLLAQLGAGVWWAATVSSDVKYLNQQLGDTKKEMKDQLRDVKEDYKILSLTLQKMQTAIAVSDARKDG